MSRLFAGQTGTESISFAGGSFPADQGPITMAALIRPDATFAAVTTFLVTGLTAGAATAFAMLTDSAKLFMNNDFSAGGPAITAGNWCWVVGTKATGSVLPRWHVHDLSAGSAWSHADGPGTVADGTGPVTTVIAGAASAAGANDWRGNIAALALFPTALTDPAVEAACTLLAADLLTAGPAWMVRLNQASTATAVTDDTGGGGNQSAISGTSVDAAEPPGWSYSLTPPAPTWSYSYQIAIGG